MSDEENKSTTEVATTEPKMPEILKGKMPTLAELHHDTDIAFKNDYFNWILNQPPPVKWVKQHPTVKKKVWDPEKRMEVSVPSEFLPIEKVELLLTRIYQTWDTEILREGTMFNAVFCTVRLHYTHPVTGEKRFSDGTGAVNVQTDAGKSAADLAAIKAAAVQMALPSAESYAIKDAAEKLGKIFGKDLNRKDAIAFSMAYQTTPPKNTMETLQEDVLTENIPQEILDTLSGYKTKNEATLLFNENKELHQFPNFKELVKKRHAEIDLEKAKLANQ